MWSFTSKRVELACVELSKLARETPAAALPPRNSVVGGTMQSDRSHVLSKKDMTNAAITNSTEL